LAACGLLAALTLAAGCASRTLTIEGYPEAHAYLEDEAGQLQPIGKTEGDPDRGRFGLRHEIMKSQRNRELAVEVRTRDMVYRYRIVTDRDVFVLYPEPEEGFFDPVRGVQPLGSESRAPRPEPASAQIEPLFGEPDTTELDTTELDSTEVPDE
jgi:hypothetical protein